MKRAGNLFDEILSRDNLRSAFHKAKKGKSGRTDVIRFAARLDDNLACLAEELRSGTIRLGEYHQFVVHDPKERIITAPHFRERVIHHAVMNVCEPILDRWLIADSFACRVGKGRNEALARARTFAARCPYFLKLDVRKYFDSISHGRLLELLARRFKDRRLLELFARLVGSFRGTLSRGLPIGSLTSQHFANFYLGWLDRHVKETLRIPGYVRYMDDIAMWSPAKEELQRALASATGFLESTLELVWKPEPYLNRTEHGMDFLGCRVYRSHHVLNRRSRVRFCRKMRVLEELFERGELSETELQQRETAMVAFARGGGVSSWRFRRRAIDHEGVGGPRARTG